jgi:hypothetical protein
LILWSTPPPFGRGPSLSSPGPPSMVCTCGLRCPSWYFHRRRPGLHRRSAPMPDRGLHRQAQRLCFLFLQNHWKTLKHVLERNCLGLRHLGHYCPNSFPLLRPWSDAVNRGLKKPSWSLTSRGLPCRGGGVTPPSPCAV